jgi:dTDP-4-amino-4,6-dideoxygalactose transaminase
VREGNYHVFNQYVIRAYERNSLKEFLTQQGIGCGIYYPLPIHLQSCYKGLGYKKGSFPEAERAAKEVLALPVYPELTIEQQELVVSTVERFYKNKK